MLFSGYFYYPCGGMDDFISCFDEKDEALEKGRELTLYDRFKWFHVYDTVDMCIVN